MWCLWPEALCCGDCVLAGTALAALAFLSQPHLLLACVPCIAVALADHDFDEVEEGGASGGAGPGQAAGAAISAQKSVARLASVDSEQGTVLRRAGCAGCCTHRRIHPHSHTRDPIVAPLLLNGRHTAVSTSGGCMCVIGSWRQPSFGGPDPQDGVWSPSGRPGSYRP